MFDMIFAYREIVQGGDITKNRMAGAHLFQGELK
jgi:hypothetical protein